MGNWSLSTSCCPAHSSPKSPPNSILVSLVVLRVSSPLTYRTHPPTVVQWQPFYTLVKDTQQNHCTVTLSDWGIPNWSLKILSIWLTDRKMVVRYKGDQSTEHPLPGGGPKVCLVIEILFLVMVRSVTVSWTSHHSSSTVLIHMLISVSPSHPLLPD